MNPAARRTIRAIRFAPVLVTMLGARPSGPNITVVDMIPDYLANEVTSNPEPSLSVNAGAPNFVVASAYAPGLKYCHKDSAPIFASIDDGNTWNIQCVLPKAKGKTPGDVTVRISGDARALYASSIGWTKSNDQYRRGASVYGLSSDDATIDALFKSGAGTVGVGKPLYWRGSTDQPQLATPPAGSSEVMQWVGNHLDSLPGSDSCAYLAAASAEQPFSVSPTVKCLAKDRPPEGSGGWPGHVFASRVATATGRTYVVMNRAVMGGDHYDIVVYRKDASAYDVITDSTPTFSGPATGSSADCTQRDGLPGFRVARCVGYDYLDVGQGAPGQERRNASELSIAVHPTDPNTVYVAWGQSSAAPEHLQLRFARSTDGGNSWTVFPWAIDQATNPALAVANDGVVGILYQRLEKQGTAYRWGTYFAISGDKLQNRPPEEMLAQFQANQPQISVNPYLGDYIELQTRGMNFYGVFSASNDLSKGTILHPCDPSLCQHQRPHLADGTPANGVHHAVTPSIDPYFVRIIR